MAETDTVVARLLSAQLFERRRHEDIVQFVPTDAGKDAADLIARLQAENEALRRALITTGRNLGAGLADTVSSDFLTLLPEEARLFAAAREAAEAKAARMEEALTAQRAFILHWTDDVNGGLKPTLGSLRSALDALRAALEAK